MRPFTQNDPADRRRTRPPRTFAQACQGGEASESVFRGSPVNNTFLKVAITLVALIVLGVRLFKPELKVDPELSLTFLLCYPDCTSKSATVYAALQ
jgi:hypothetical protein